LRRRRVPRRRAPLAEASGAHVPIRTCAGCGGRAPRAEMRRVALSEDRRSLEWRSTGGRGTYLHESADCVRRFVDAKKAIPGLRVRMERAERLRLVESGYSWS
jgi:predicted RNA-binding protein YlxR (DUF448 family)